MASILIVDDEPGIRSALETLFSGDFLVYQADSGAQALEVLKGADVDAILLDLLMPRMGGGETLSRIRRTGCSAPVVLMSVFWQSGWACSSRDLGIFGFISKPWDTEVLRGLVRLAIAHGNSARQGRGFALAGFRC